MRAFKAGQGRTGFTSWPARAARLSIALLLVGTPPVFAASATWVGTLPRQVVAASENPLEGGGIEPPAHVHGGKITRVHWSFVTDGSGPLRAWLCQGSLCVALPGGSGVTERFQGRPADEPVRFRFWYPSSHGAEGHRVVSQGRIVVDYRP